MIERTTRRSGGPRLRIGVLAAAIAFAAAAGSAVAADASDAPHALDLAQTPGRCGAPPSSLAAGPVTFQVTDDSRDFVNVYVVASGDIGTVYAEIQDLAPHATLPLATDLGAGSYSVRCVFGGGMLGTSSAIRVTGTTAEAVPGYVALPDLDLQTPVHQYSAWVESQLPKLLADSRALDADVAAGNVAAAKQAWLTAHLDYERLGAAYNAFGDFDDEIDGMANGLPDGVADTSWTGFFATEYALWHGEPTAKVRALTKALVANVAGLQQDFPSEEVDPGDLSLRAHEILENALQFQLTGIADYGSGTTLATIYANTQGTEELIGILAPLITRADPQLLTDAQQGLSALQRDLSSDHVSSDHVSSDLGGADLAGSDLGGGTWLPVTALSVVGRQRLDADLGELLETLSGVPALLYPRTNA
ncbi:EfeM/EfeO family lipoprotein [Actinospica sp.]|uniref:EfeM/EfeO family lipoprotein n=1 Tax=Actinospica sp. TaxID=1872142 RepID=UPI002BC0271D|nr:EfeM/EfeO family lipoprotein [Actinospica sp.]HWG24071.1 EfeM/EfeO family lipoprotein [Actinospica sp.]